MLKGIQGNKKLRIKNSEMRKGIEAYIQMAKSVVFSLQRVA
jgi:hypothetical protein